MPHATSRNGPSGRLSGTVNLPRGLDSVSEVPERAVADGDEHAIKFTDAAAEVHTRTGDPDALAPAVHIRDLIEPVA
jgi:hypothetical protein